MGTPDTTHGQKLKHTLQYAEQRRTLWLNTHAKDDFGRHRGAVLYGMNVTATGPKTLRVAPGAVYTPYGTRFFFEQYSSSQKPTFNQVDVSAPDDLFGLVMQGNYPVVACVFLKFLVTDPRVQPRVDDIAEFDTTNIEFNWRVVPHDRADVHPTNNLEPRDPILLDRVQPDAYEYEASAELDVRKPSVQYFDPGNANTAALQFGEIPLAYVVIGADPATGAPPTSLLDPGVEIVQCRNLFSTLGDVLGHDVFFGRHGKRVTGAVVSPQGTALRQGYSQRQVGGNTTPELLSPKFGTGEPDSTKISPIPDPQGEAYKSDQDKASWNDALWDSYRQPSLLRDGDGVVWALRRLDYYLRLWMDRTGDQSLVSTIQDGQLSMALAYSISSVTLATGPSGEDEITVVGAATNWVGATVTVEQGNANDGSYLVLSVAGDLVRVAPGSLSVPTAALGSLTVSIVTPGSLPHVRPMMTLDAILQHFRGDDGAVTNVNVLSYPDNQSGAGSNPFNHVVKSGRAAHQPQSLDNVQATGYGDTHVNAISALDLGVWHVLEDLMGREFARRAMRRANSWRSGSGLDAGVLGPDLVTIAKALRHDDGPTGRLPIADTGDGYQRPENWPSFSGPVRSAYMAYEPMYEALRVLADRAQAAPNNWLRNRNFLGGDNSSSPDPLPPGWNGTNVSSWLRSPLSVGLGLAELNVTLGASGKLSQVVDFEGTELSDILTTCNVMHAALAAKVISGQVRFGVRGLTGADAQVFEVARDGLTASATFDSYSFAYTMEAPYPTTVEKLEFFVDTVAGAQVAVLGASAGPGAPETTRSYDRNNYEYLLRDGGLYAKMRGHIVLDGHDIVRGTDYTDPVWTDDEGPAGGAVVLTGAALRGYPQQFAKVLEVTDDVVAKLNVGVGENMVANPRMVGMNPATVSGSATSVSSNFTTVPQPVLDWTFAGAGAGTWSIQTATGNFDDASDWGVSFRCQLVAGASVAQTLTDADAGGAIPDLPGQLVSQGGVASMAVTLKTDQPLTLTLQGTGGTAWQMSKTLPATAAVRTHTVTFRLPVNTTTDTVVLTISNGGGATADVQFFGVSLTAGMPKPCASRLEHDFMPAAGSIRHHARGPMFMGTPSTRNQIKELADAVEDYDAVNKKTALFYIYAALAGLSNTWNSVGGSAAVGPQGGNSTATFTGSEQVLFDASNPDFFALFKPLWRNGSASYHADTAWCTAWGCMSTYSGGGTVSALSLSNVGAMNSSTVLQVTTSSGAYNVPADNMFHDVAHLFNDGPSHYHSLDFKLRWSGNKLYLQTRGTATQYLAAFIISTQAATSFDMSIAYSVPTGPFAPPNAVVIPYTL